jgi:cytoplasmic tRNA 2-thiolation protein 2
MNNFFQALPTSSSQSSVITHLIRIILSRFAAANTCSHLLLGTTLTSMSVGLISCITEGGGFHIQEEIEERFGTLKVVRPLRDVSLKEASLYLWWNNLRVIPHVSKEKTRGIRDLTKGSYLSNSFEISANVMMQISSLA